MERKIVFFEDTRTGQKTYTRAEQMRRKIIKAVIRDDGINDGTQPFPVFLDKENKKNFLDNAATLIAEFMTDRQTFNDLMDEIKEDVECDKARKCKEYESEKRISKRKRARNLKEKLDAELEEIETCLHIKRNRLPEPLNDLCNPNTSGWRSDENILISKLLVVYRKFTPLKTSRRIYENMAMIFIACGLRPEMTEKDCSSLSETLRKRKIKQSPTM